jgi:3-hexulose-6-phosphate synthase
MKLQIALDDLTLEEAADLVEKVYDCIDIIEIGTPMILKEGMAAVRRMKTEFPEKEILADTKIMDAGYLEAESAFEAGADYVTVLGVTDILTIKACVKAAGKYQGRVVADMLCVRNMEERIREVEEAGVHYLAVHTGYDQQQAGHTPLSDLRLMKACARSAGISVAGGINSDTIEEYTALNPDIIIVGGGICHAEDPCQASFIIHQAIRKAQS